VESRPGEPFANCADALATRRQNTENSESATVDDDLVIDENPVLAVAPMLGVDFDLELSP
jgi:hypothetical protein